MHLLPQADRLYLKNKQIFQEDSVLLQRAKSRQIPCQLSKVIKHYDRPRSFPDRNPYIFLMWCIIEFRIDAKQHTSFNSFKAFILHEWSKLPLKMIRAEVGQWRKRLSLIIYTLIQINLFQDKFTYDVHLIAICIIFFYIYLKS